MGMTGLFMLRNSEREASFFEVKIKKYAGYKRRKRHNKRYCDYSNYDDKVNGENNISHFYTSLCLI